MDLQLAGKRALVTGSTSGIGAAIALKLAAEGATVLVHGRRKQAVEDMVQNVIAAGGSAEPVVGDLTVEVEAQQVAEAALHRGVDILINNSGTYANSTWQEATPAEWLDRYDSNVVAAVRLIRALILGMRERRWGRIVQIASGEATAPFPVMPDYAATKAAIVNVTVSLAKYLDRTGITVNTVSPGIIVTPSLQAFYQRVAADRGWGDEWPEIEDNVLKNVLNNPSGRLGRPADVANLVAYVVSPLADYINGANLRVDGGSTACIN